MCANRHDGTPPGDVLEDGAGGGVRMHIRKSLVVLGVVMIAGLPARTYAQGWTLDGNKLYTTGLNNPPAVGIQDENMGSDSLGLIVGGSLAGTGATASRVAIGVRFAQRWAPSTTWPFPGPYMRSSPTNGLYYYAQATGTTGSTQPVMTSATPGMPFGWYAHAVWQPNYRVKPLLDNGHRYRVTNGSACTTGETVPAFCTTSGCTSTPTDGTCTYVEDGNSCVTSFNDGTVTWVCVGSDPNGKSYVTLDGIDTASPRIRVTHTDNDVSPGLLIGEHVGLVDQSGVIRPYGIHVLSTGNFPDPRYIYPTVEANLFFGVYPWQPHIADPLVPLALTATTATGGTITPGCWELTYAWEAKDTAGRTGMAPRARLLVSAPNNAIGITLPSYPPNVGRAWIYGVNNGPDCSYDFERPASDDGSIPRLMWLDAPTQTGTFLGVSGEPEVGHPLNYSSVPVLQADTTFYGAWTASTVYNAGVSIVPTSSFRAANYPYSNHRFVVRARCNTWTGSGETRICTSMTTDQGTACTSRPTEPAWNTAPSALTVDGATSCTAGTAACPCIWEELGSANATTLLRPASQLNGLDDILQVHNGDIAAAATTDPIVAAIHNDGTTGIGFTRGSCAGGSRATLFCQTNADCPGSTCTITSSSHGWLGVGTLNPTAGLDVTGAATLDATLDQASIRVANLAPGGGTWFLRPGATGTTEAPAGGFSITNGGTPYLSFSSNGVATSGSGLRVHRTQVNNGEYTAQTTDYLIAYVTLSQAHKVTLPTVAGAGAGFELVIKDESGNATSGHAISVANAGDGAKLDGASASGAGVPVISMGYGAVRLYTNGVDWFRW